MKKLVRAIATVGALLLVAAPAGATHTPPGDPFVPEYVETPVFLHCGSARIGNVHATVDGTRVTWDATKPSASYTSGAGCATVDTFSAGTANHNPIYDFPMQGSFTGNLDNLTIRLWAIELSGSRALNEFTVDLHLEIDGEQVITRPTLAYAPTGGAGTDVARLYEVTVTNIGLDSEADHTMEHDVQLTVYPKFVDGSGVLLWPYDTSEFDSGLVFNDTTPSAVKIARNG